VITAKSAHGVARTSLRRVDHGPSLPARGPPPEPSGSGLGLGTKKKGKIFLFFSFFPQRPSPHRQSIFVRIGNLFPGSNVYFSGSDVYFVQDRMSLFRIGCLFPGPEAFFRNECFFSGSEFFFQDRMPFFQ